MTNITEKTNNIQEQIQEEIEQARAVCDVSGENSGECAAAWDAVEELQAEASHQRQSKPKNSLEKYCDANPDADECRVYED
ncbi:Calvin cycle protein CP12 [Trichormus azollae]|jgi:predicted nuclease with TOPRIM domain|uniref:Calvin cycle protein CP12 n=1 Tax=Trichormus azollae TaxID=1164 RepID=UPI00325F1163